MRKGSHHTKKARAAISRTQRQLWQGPVGEKWRRAQRDRWPVPEGELEFYNDLINRLRYRRDEALALIKQLRGK
jgi:hypothetical protein